VLGLGNSLLGQVEQVGHELLFGLAQIGQGFDNRHYQFLLCGRAVIGGFGFGSRRAVNLRHRAFKLTLDKFEQHRECPRDPNGLVILFDALGRKTLRDGKKTTNAVHRI
jgi:hypothetical protein